MVAQETSEAVFSVDRSGHGATRIGIPPLPGTRDNKGLESLGHVESAEGRYLFAANEQALESDGPVSTVERGTVVVVRILRRRLGGGDGGGAGGNDSDSGSDHDDLEVAYQTEPVFARASKGGESDNGVSDIAVLSPERLLVLERAYVPGAGNAIRIYEVDLRGARDVREMADASAAAPVAKRLVLDLALLPDARCAGPARPGPSRALENYEGMALGPLLPDGRRVLFLVSDDNCCESGQRPRLLAIALARGALE